MAGAVALGAVGAYAFLVRPALAERVPRWLGWEHGVLTIIGAVLLAVFFTRNPRTRIEPPPRGRRHEQTREARVDPEFRDAAGAYARYVRDGHDRDRVVTRITRALVAAGADEAEAERLVHARLPESRTLGLPSKAREERRRAVRALLARADEVARRPARAHDLTVTDHEKRIEGGSRS